MISNVYFQGEGMKNYDVKLYKKSTAMTQIVHVRAG